MTLSMLVPILKSMQSFNLSYSIANPSLVVVKKGNVV